MYTKKTGEKFLSLHQILHCIKALYHIIFNGTKIKHLDKKLYYDRFIIVIFLGVHEFF